MKTSELTGAALDWAVAKCNNNLNMHFMTQWEQGHRNYSTDWSQGGQIIEREKIKLDPWRDRWEATSWNEALGSDFAYGPTPLIAAMRCLVASRLGDEVDVPKELL
jgi:hypothetical protein